MNDKKKWNRRMAPHIYDYNYKVGQSYYTPQTEYIENRDLLRSKITPPEAMSYAERYAERPIYGNVRGLPYDYTQSELSRPLVNRRAQSTGRAQSRERDIDDIPSDSRLGRSRDRKVSFDTDDYRQKFSVDNALNYQDPIKRYSRKSEPIASESDFNINPKMKKELVDEFDRIKKQFKKADSMERGSVPKTSQYEETAYDSDLMASGRRRVKREEVNYTLPPTGSKIRKSSYTETSKIESSKPPRVHKPLRLSSIEDDLDFKLPTRTSRLRKFSTSDIDDDDNFNLKYQIPRPKSRNRTVEEETKFQQGLSLREQRRTQESEQLSSNISNLIDKMKNHDLEDGYKFTRSIRASSLDPYEREPRALARVQARAHQFTYGVSK